MLFEKFCRQTTELIKDINFSKEDTRTEFLCLVLQAVIKGTEESKFHFPTVKELFYTNGLEAGALKPQRRSPKTEIRVQILSAYLDVAWLDIDDLEAWDRNALLLMEQILLLYKREQLCPTTAKEYFRLANKSELKAASAN